MKTLTKIACAAGALLSVFVVIEKTAQARYLIALSAPVLTCGGLEVTIVPTATMSSTAQTATM